MAELPPKGLRLKLSRRLHGLKRSLRQSSSPAVSLPPDRSPNVSQVKGVDPPERPAEPSPPSPEQSTAGLQEKVLEVQTPATVLGGESRPVATTPPNDTDSPSADPPLDLWSAAFQEAVASFGDELDVAILKGKSTAEMFQRLEDIDKEATKESVVIRGMRHLQTLQVPLERFKLALDLSSSLTFLDPTTTASSVVGVVRAVTTIAISCATADLEFSKLIAEMLEQISYIDDCDTLGQKSNQKDIHDALVMVYKKLLEFYQAAFEILTKKGVRLVLKVVLESAHLPAIVQEFLKKAEFLRKLVEKATWEIVEDIKTMLYDREIARWLGSSKISQQVQYHAYLQGIRADKACDFLLEETNLVQWYCAVDSQQLLLLGGMGCGKSVAMSYIIDKLSHKNESQLPRPKICYYYCRDSKTSSLVSVLSTVILSLLEQLTGLKKVFYNWYKDNQASGHVDPANNAGKLEEFLKSVLLTLDRRLLIIVDGLDELDRVSRNRLLLLMKQLLSMTTRLNILLSSRVDEEILQQLDGIDRVIMASNLERDSVIVKQTVERQLPYLTDTAKHLVVEKLSRMAQGSGIWTKMVVELLEIRAIRALDPLHLFLKEVPLPKQLSTLYRNLLLERCSNDPDNLELANTALKFLAICRRPLGISELAWAVAIGVSAEEIESVADLAAQVDHQRLLHVIHPFIVRVDFDDLQRHQVQLAHQSIKEFVVQELALSEVDLLKQDTKKKRGKSNFNHCIESLEAQALDLCAKYLLLDEIGKVELFSEDQKAIEELPQGIDLFSDENGSPVDYDPTCTWDVWEKDMIRYDPAERGFGEFFAYASSHWLDHFGAIKSEPFPDIHTMEQLCQPNSQRLDNWIQQHRRPGCVIIARFQFDTILYDLLAITSLYGSEALLKHTLHLSNLQGEMYLPQSLIGAAEQILSWGELSRLKILYLDRCHQQLDQLEFFSLIMTHWSSNTRKIVSWDLAFDLVLESMEAMIKEKWGNELLCMAARAGCLPVIQRLLHSANKMPELSIELFRPDRPGADRQSIGEAVLANQPKVVECLLQEKGIEQHLQHTTSEGQNVLHLASGICNPETFNLLVPHLVPRMHEIDRRGDTPLVRVLKSSADSDDRHECMRIAFSHSSHADGRHWQDLLHMATQLEDVDMRDFLSSCIQDVPGSFTGKSG